MTITDLDGYTTGYYVQYDMCDDGYALKTGDISITDTSNYKCVEVKWCDSTQIPSYCNASAACNEVNGEIKCTCPTGYSGDQCSECTSGIYDSSYCW